MTVDFLLQKGKEELKKVVSQPYQESLWIMAGVLQLNTTEVYLLKSPVSREQTQLFWENIRKRKSGWPLDYIFKEKTFYNKNFYFEPGVFIPRSETETIIEWVLKNIPKTDIKAVDFGSGIGTLCLTLLYALPKMEFLALEICRKSIECLKRNSRNFQVTDRLHILRRDINHLKPQEICDILGEPPSLIVANPPYIDPKDKSISKEVRFFEPPMAIFSNKGGMGHICSWFEKSMSVLRSRGVFLFEFGWNQEEKVKRFCESREDLSHYEIFRDQLNLPRISVCFKK